MATFCKQLREQISNTPPQYHSLHNIFLSFIHSRSQNNFLLSILLYNFPIDYNRAFLCSFWIFDSFFLCCNIEFLCAHIHSIPSFLKSLSFFFFFTSNLWYYFYFSIVKSILFCAKLQKRLLRSIFMQCKINHSKHIWCTYTYEHEQIYKWNIFCNEIICIIVKIKIHF